LIQRPFPISLALLLTCGLFACGKKKSEIPALSTTTAPISNPINFVPQHSLEDAQATAKSAIVKCVDSVDCHPSVGMLSMASLDPQKGWGSGRCTGSLIGPDLVLTNAHCIPSDLREIAKASCGNRIWLTFASSGKFPSEQAECKQVIFVSEDSPETSLPDYALIKLSKPMTRPFIQVDRKGIKEGETLIVHRVTPLDSDGLFGGIQNSVECDPYYSPLFAPHFDNPFAATAMVSNCEIFPGNSGSPVLDKKGKARGVIFALVQKAEVIAAFNLGSAIKEDQLDDMNMVTNLACLKNVSKAEIPSDCSKKTRTEEYLKKERYRKQIVQLDKMAQEVIGEYEALKDIPFDWEIRQKTVLGLAESEQLHYPAPKCYQQKSKDQKVHWMRPTWTVETLVSSKLQVVKRLKMRDMEKATLKIRSTEQKGRMEYQMIAKDFSYKGIVSPCLLLKKSNE